MMVFGWEGTGDLTAVGALELAVLSIDCRSTERG